MVQTSKTIRLPTYLGRWLSTALIATMMALSTIVVAAELPSPQTIAQSDSSPNLSPQKSKRIRRTDIWQEVYRQLPELPREDQYISQNSGNISSSTLVNRLIEYHNFRKGRSPISRFDWKLTMADYLGLNEVMLASSYPGATKLTQNPMAGDQSALDILPREQRNQLINTLVSLYNPRIPSEFFTPAPLAPGPDEATRPSSRPAELQPPLPPNRPALSPLSEPGTADLLRPRP